jgi:murein DD-endopeptidase MepM/ murein hydrolase activator NlpD
VRSAPVSDLLARAGAPATRFPPSRASRADFGLCVDLGDAPLCARWWRGLATLLLLVGAVLAAGLQAARAPLPQPPEPPRVEAWARDPGQLITAPLALGGAGPAPQAPRWGTLAVRLAEPPERPRIEVVARADLSGDLVRTLVRSGVGRDEARAVAALAQPLIEGGRLAPGTPLAMVQGRRETKTVPRPLESLALRAAFNLKLEVNRREDGSFALTRIPIAIDHTPLLLAGRVGGSLARSARATGAPAGAVGEFTRALGHRFDIERDFRAGDQFALAFEHQRAETGETRTGRLLYGRIERSRGEDIELARWRWGGGEQWFMADGQSVRRGLMRTPVDRGRLTSGFGMRLHPILGYSRLHRGVDFAAPTGTPVLAAADGTVTFAAWGGGYGRVVKLAHAQGLATAYAHLSAMKVTPGQRVRQGQVIGLVGSSGLSTGPHLHYEVYQGGRPVDPRQARFLDGPRLAGADLAAFRAQVERMRRLRPGGAVGQVALDPATGPAPGEVQAESRPARGGRRQAG